MSTSESIKYSDAPDYAKYPRLLEYVSMPNEVPKVDVELPPFSVSVKRITGKNYQVKASWHPNPQNAILNPWRPSEKADANDLRWFAIKHSTLAENNLLADLNPAPDVVIKPEDFDHVFFWGLDTPNPGAGKAWTGNEGFKLLVEISDVDDNGTRHIVFQRYVGVEVTVDSGNTRRLKTIEEDQSTHWRRFKAITTNQQLQQEIRNQWAQQERIYEDFDFARDIKTNITRWTKLYAKKD